MATPRIQSRANKAAKAVIENLRSRRGLGQEYGALDLDVRLDLADKWSRIIADTMVMPIDSTELALAEERDSAVEVVRRIRGFVDVVSTNQDGRAVIASLMSILDSTVIGCRP